MPITALTDIPNCAIWLRRGTGLYKDAGVTLATSSADTVQQWSDASGLGHHATQATAANRPKYTSLGGLQNDGTQNTWLALPNIFNGATAGEVVVLFRLNLNLPTDSSKTGLLWLSNDGADNHFPWTDGTIYDGVGSVSRYSYAHAGVDLTTEHVYGSWSAANDWGAHLDGTTKSTSAANTVGYPTAPLLGKSNGGYYVNGCVLAFGWFTRKLTSTERADAVAFLQADGLTAGTSTPRLTQAAALVLTENTAAKARLTQAAALVLTENTAAKARLTQLALLVLTDPPPVTSFPFAFCQVVG